MFIFNIDYKYYPYISIIVGFLIGDLIGAVSAFFLVRELVSNKVKEVGYELALLKLSSMLIKADGHINDGEIAFVKSFFTKTFGSAKSKKLFKDLKDGTTPSSLSLLVDIIMQKVNPNKLYSIIQFLYGLASSDGKITQGEDDFIFNVGFLFGFNKERLIEIRNQFLKRESKSNKYSSKVINSLAVLGLKEDATIMQVKKSYKNLAKEYHPDKLVGMSSGIIKLAKEKFQEVQDAYEYLRKNYV